MTPKFEIGTPVTCSEFTDCFGKVQPAVTGLTVAELKLIAPDSIAAYYRVKAIGVNGRGYVSAAERFFEQA